MTAIKTVAYTSDEIARREIHNFIKEGLEDVKNHNFSDIDQAFDEIERRYQYD